MGRSTAVKNLMVKPATLTEARALTDSDSGKTYFLNAAGGFTVILPAPRGGVNFRFIVKTAPTTGDYKIACKASASVIMGQVITSDLNATARPDFVITGIENIKLKANIAKIGDSVDLISDGTYWYANGFSATIDGTLFVEESKSPSKSPSTSVSRSPSRSPSCSPSISPSAS